MLNDRHLRLNLPQHGALLPLDNNPIVFNPHLEFSVLIIRISLLPCQLDNLLRKTLERTNFQLEG